MNDVEVEKKKINFVLLEKNLMISSMFLFKSLIEDDSILLVEGTNLLKLKQNSIENHVDSSPTYRQKIRSPSLLILIDFPVHVSSNEFSQQNSFCFLF